MRIQVDVPQSAIEEKTKKALDAANRKIKKLEQRVADLEMQIALNAELVQQAEGVKAYVKQAFFLYTYDEIESGF